MISILSSGVGLGAYMPSQIILHQLKQQGIPAQICLVENLFRNEKLEVLRKTRTEFSRNFALASVASRMPSSMEHSIDPERLEQLLNHWVKTKCSFFVVFSGFWMKILNQFRQLSSAPVVVDACKIDAGTVGSWKDVRIDELPLVRDIQFFDLENKRINYTLGMDRDQPEFHQRMNRVVFHGGGWGIGEFYERSVELAERNAYTPVSVIQNRPSALHPRIQYYMNDPEWDIFDVRNSGTLPSFYKMSNDRVQRVDYHIAGVYDLVRGACAIVGKPGGMTVAECVEGRTPLIVLSSLANEEKNSRFVKDLDMGCSWDEWKDSNFDYRMLLRFHASIVDHVLDTKPYYRNLLQRYRETRL